MKKVLSLFILLIFTTIVFACVAGHSKCATENKTAQQQNGFDIFSKYSSN